MPPKEKYEPEVHGRGASFPIPGRENLQFSGGEGKARSRVLWKGARCTSYCWRRGSLFKYWGKGQDGIKALRGENKGLPARLIWGGRIGGIVEE